MFKKCIPVLKWRHSLHTSSIVAGKAGKTLQKIINGTKKRKYYYEDVSPVLPVPPSIFGRSNFDKKITGSSRRSNSLNKLFMRHVTDIMATGEYSQEILGYGIEVNQVKVSNDYKFVRVYYIAKESESLEEIDDLLKRNAGYLRRELSELRVVGQVPNIVFVRDKNYSKFAEVDDRLRKADFGDDYIPPDLTDQFRSELNLLTTLESNLKDKVQAQSIQDNAVDDFDDIPIMPQNVLGLNHADILKRVKQRMSKSKAEHRNADTTDWLKWSEFKSTQPINQDPVAFANHQEQRKAFKDFLIRRQIMKSKQNKADKNWTAEREYIEEEMMERYQRRLASEREVEEKDYIVEDIEDEK